MGISYGQYHADGTILYPINHSINQSIAIGGTRPPKAISNFTEKLHFRDRFLPSSYLAHTSQSPLSNSDRPLIKHVCRWSGGEGLQGVSGSDKCVDLFRSSTDPGLACDGPVTCTPHTDTHLNLNQATSDFS